MATAVADVTETTQDFAGWPYRFEIIPLDDLGVDQDYQRPLTDFWKKVASDFNPALVGCLVVSERKNGSKHIIDGQTRAAAMKQNGLIDAPCLVFSGLSKPMEARLFADLQTQRRGMRTYHRFRAQLVAKEPQALEIARIARAQGFQLGVEEESYTLGSIAALESIYKFDPDHLADVLSVVREVWGVEDRTAVKAQLLRGLSTFIRQQEKLNYERLHSRLRDVTPNLILNIASQIREGASTGSGLAPSVAQAITKVYLQKGPR